MTAGSRGVINLLTSLLDVAASPLFRQGLTLLRCIGTLRANSTDANLSAETAMGFIMADGDAVSTANTPNPSLDVDAPWLWWDRRVLLPPSDSGQHLRLDIKAQRRLAGNDTTLLFLIDNDDATQSLEFALGLRMLFKLS